MRHFDAHRRHTAQHGVENGAGVATLDIANNLTAAQLATAAWIDHNVGNLASDDCPSPRSSYYDLDPGSSYSGSSESSTSSYSSYSGSSYDSGSSSSFDSSSSCSF